MVKIFESIRGEGELTLGLRSFANWVTSFVSFSSVATDSRSLITRSHFDFSASAKVHNDCDRALGAVLYSLSWYTIIAHH